MIYLVYTTDHRSFGFADIKQAREFRKRKNAEKDVTWYLAEVPINYGIDEGIERRSVQLNKAKFAGQWRLT